MRIGKIFASAGCGKTTQLLNHLDDVFKNGTKPENVLFTTFTRAGAYEARDRAIEKFNFDPDKFIYFRTLHSICYRELRNVQVMSHSHYITLGRQLHVRFGSAGFSEELYERGKGDALLALYNLQRNILAPDNMIPEEHGIGASKEEYQHFIETYDNYRRTHGLKDYTDLLVEIHQRSTWPGLDIQYAFIDEAQDLTRLQYEVVKKLTQRAEVCWFAGDDDQCVFAYSGADPKILIDMEANEQIILGKTYRLPTPIANYANEIAHRIQYREAKVIQSVFDDKNEPTRVSRTTDFLSSLVKGEPTVILCRNRLFFCYFEFLLKQQGLLYSYIKASSDEEELDKNNIEQVCTAVTTWTEMIQNPDALFNAENIWKTIQFIPIVLLNRKHRGRILELNKDTPLSYNRLVNEFGLEAQDVWQKTLSEIPYDMLEYVEVLSNKNALYEPSYIRIGTIHSFKGKEEDHVIVCPEMTWRTWKNYQDDPDKEHRVFYVAMTRAKERLTVLEPLTKYHYVT